MKKLFILQLLQLIVFVNFNTASSQNLPGAGNAFDFNQGRSVLPPTNGLSPSSTFTQLTFETWVYWRGLSGNNPSGILEGRSAGIHFEITTNTGSLRLRVDGNQITYTNAVPLNQWVHLAFTADVTAGETKVYVNGNLIGTNTQALGTPNFSNYFRIGTSCCGDVNPANITRPFNGFLDEVKIWYRVKTQAEIQQSLTLIPSGNQQNLVLYYNFDNIVNNQVQDLSGNGNHGAVSGGLNQNHIVISGAPVGNDNETVFSSNWTGVEIIKGPITISNVQGSPSAVSIYEVTGMPNTTNGIDVMPSVIDNYYGVSIIGGTNPSYSINFNYTSYLNKRSKSISTKAPISEPDLRLFKRSNNASNTWIMSTDDTHINLNDETISLASLSGGNELILAQESNPLPVELIFFEAKLNKGFSSLKWITASETNNYGFSVQKSKDGVDFQQIKWIEGVGNSSNETSYNLIDENPFVGENYYKLIQIDFDGTEKIYGPVLLINEQNMLNFNVFPNPSQTGIFYLTNLPENILEIAVTHVSGKTVFNESFSTENNFLQKNLNIQNFDKGIYFVMVTTLRHSKTVKLIKL